MRKDNERKGFRFRNMEDGTYVDCTVGPGARARHVDPRGCIVPGDTRARRPGTVRRRIHSLDQCYKWRVCLAQAYRGKRKGAYYEQPFADAAGWMQPRTQGVRGSFPKGGIEAELVVGGAVLRVVVVVMVDWAATLMRKSALRVNKSRAILVFLVVGCKVWGGGRGKYSKRSEVKDLGF